MKRDDRKYRSKVDTMMVLGLGYFFMGGWVILRTILLCTLNHSYLNLMVVDSLNSPTFRDSAGIAADADLSHLVTPVTIAVIILLLFLALIDSGLRVLTGICALSEAKGKRNRFLILFLIILIGMDAVSVIVGVNQFSIGVSVDFIDFLGTFFLNVMLLVVTIDLLVATAYVKRYRKHEAKGTLIDRTQNPDNKETKEE